MRVVELNIDPDAVRDAIIVYKDAANKQSERQIRPMSVAANFYPETGFFGITTIHAYCRVRKGIRSFRIDRIAEVYDTDTGEQVALFDWVKTLPLLNLPEHEAAPAAAMNAGEAANSTWLMWSLTAFGVALFLVFLIGKCSADPGTTAAGSAPVADASANTTGVVPPRPHHHRKRRNAQSEVKAVAAPDEGGDMVPEAGASGEP
ncbi:hypothetical protein [Novosphingobium sp. FSW06-99]|uniref:WYL domain-containing protein n=1 Tax=Novosphingobium sp. FSW06-99 TaxID=1739113 RepID=UPI00076D85D9|nr:hypothetical protein [Novosphingobium sp. FSW06-99]KUR80777.1 hypothetical protein AQZ49_01750 [Novosphingobium sp. FSW06-99]